MGGGLIIEEGGVGSEPSANYALWMIPKTLLCAGY